MTERQIVERIAGLHPFTEVNGRPMCVYCGTWKEPHRWRCLWADARRVLGLEVNQEDDVGIRADALKPGDRFWWEGSLVRVISAQLHRGGVDVVFSIGSGCPIWTETLTADLELQSPSASA